MKLSDIRPNIETSGDLEEQFFSVQDQGMIFDILRNKMYSNPILAICREISCNARDAHREIGTPHIPIKISLPTNLEPYFKIKDFGPGISPDRMSNIFIKYTASTKRSDNIQTGGFGLGAKTPFSYTDTFTIVTNFNGIAYNYACLIDETKVGKLIKLSETATKDPNGTEIVIPVKSADFQIFNKWIEQATRYWDVKPEFVGGIINYIKCDKVLEGSTWAFINSYDYHSTVKLIIDGIEYPLDMAALRSYADAKILDSTRSTLLLYFGVGELSLSANREQVYLDDATQNKIKTRLSQIIKEIKQNISDKINQFPNLWDANVFYRKQLQQLFYDLSFLGPLTWQGITLHNKYIDCPGFIFTKGKYYHTRSTDPNRISSGSLRLLSFAENSILYLNDLGLQSITSKHVKKAFEDDPKLTSLQIVCPNDKLSLSDLNKSIYLDKMQPKLLSSLTDAKTKKYTPATSRLLVFKYDPNVVGFRQVSYSSIDGDTNTKVLCLTAKDYQNNRRIVLSNKKQLLISAVHTVMKCSDKVSFYGIDENLPKDRIKEEFAGFILIEDFMQDAFKNNLINYVELKYALKHQYEIDEHLLSSKLESLIKDKSSLFLKRYNLHKKIKDIVKKDIGALEIYEVLNGDITPDKIDNFIKDNPDYDAVSLNEKFNKKYPLISHISYYNLNKCFNELAHYINLIDTV